MIECGGELVREITCNGETVRYAKSGDGTLVWAGAKFTKVVPTSYGDDSDNSFVSLQVWPCEETNFIKMGGSGSVVTIMSRLSSEIKLKVTDIEPRSFNTGYDIGKFTNNTGIGSYANVLFDLPITAIDYDGNEVDEVRLCEMYIEKPGAMSSMFVNNSGSEYAGWKFRSTGEMTIRGAVPLSEAYFPEDYS